MQHYGQSAGAEIWASVIAADTAHGAVESYLMTTARAFTRGDCPTGCLVVLSALHVNGATEALRADLVDKRAANTADLAEVLARGVENGEIPSTADVWAIARFYVTVQQGMSIQARDGADRGHPGDDRPLGAGCMGALDLVLMRRGLAVCGGFFAEQRHKP